MSITYHKSTCVKCEATFYQPHIWRPRMYCDNCSHEFRWEMQQGMRQCTDIDRNRLAAMQQASASMINTATAIAQMGAIRMSTVEKTYCRSCGETHPVNDLEHGVCSTCGAKNTKGTDEPFLMEMNLLSTLCTALAIVGGVLFWHPAASWVGGSAVMFVAAFAFWMATSSESAT